MSSTKWLSAIDVSTNCPTKRKVSGSMPLSIGGLSTGAVVGCAVVTVGVGEVTVVGDTVTMLVVRGGRDRSADDVIAMKDETSAIAGVLMGGRDTSRLGDREIDGKTASLVSGDDDIIDVLASGGNCEKIGAGLVEMIGLAPSVVDVTSSAGVLETSVMSRTVVLEISWLEINAGLLSKGGGMTVVVSSCAEEVNCGCIDVSTGNRPTVDKSGTGEGNTLEVAGTL